MNFLICSYQIQKKQSPLITFNHLFERHEDCLERGEEILDQETYYDEFRSIFSFTVEGQVSLAGSLDEVFTHILGESNFICDINWDSLKEGEPFTISYLGESTTCLEGFSDNDAYSEGMMALTSILKKARLVLKVPVEMDEGISSDFSLVLIDLDIWNRGIAEFGNEALEALFIDFDTFYNTPIPNYEEVMTNLIQHLEGDDNPKALDRLKKRLIEDHSNNDSKEKLLDHSEISPNIWVRPSLKQPLPIYNFSPKSPEAQHSGSKNRQPKIHADHKKNSFFNNPILQVVGTIALIILLLRKIIEYWF